FHDSFLHTHSSDKIFCQKKILKPHQIICAMTFAYSVVYSIQTCPLIFSNTSMDILEFYGITNTMLRKNPLGFANSQSDKAVYNLKKVIFHLYHYDLTVSLLKKSLFTSSKSIWIIGQMNSIDKNIMDSLSVKEMYFETESIYALSQDGGLWLNSIQDTITQNTTFGSLTKISISVDKDYFFNESDICYFRHVPSNKSFYFYPMMIHYSRSCTCSKILFFSSFLHINKYSNLRESYRQSLEYWTLNSYIESCIDEQLFVYCQQKLDMCSLKKLKSSFIFQLNQRDLSFSDHYFDLYFLDR
ncbi:hypothetical protein BpHYR1_051573, partial [Brachionus plicatilis]